MPFSSANRHELHNLECTGLGNLRAFQALQRITCEHCPSLLFTVEAKVSSTVGESWKFLLNFDEFIGVDVVGRSGGLLLYWSDSIHMSLRSYSLGHIDCYICYDNLSWRFTGFYGYPVTHLKHSWELLQKLNVMPLIYHDVWLVGGDFNEILYACEKRGRETRPTSQMNAFPDVINELELHELLAKGPRFTWINKRKGRELILEKLDRYLANQDWLDLFPNMEVCNLDFMSSDHRPVKLYLNNQQRMVTHRPTPKFKFEAKWLLEEDFESVVSNAWTVGNGSTLPQRLKSSGDTLRQWAKEVVGNATTRMKDVQKQLDKALNEAKLRWDKDEVSRLEKDLEKLQFQDEIHRHQRSRVNWMTDGDRNTTYLHKLASIRRKKSRIKGLMDDTGNWHEDNAGMESIVTEYYGNMFSSQQPSAREIKL